MFESSCCSVIDKVQSCDSQWIITVKRNVWNSPQINEWFLNRSWNSLSFVLCLFFLSLFFSSPSLSLFLNGFSNSVWFVMPNDFSWYGSHLKKSKGKREKKEKISGNLKINYVSGAKAKKWRRVVCDFKVHMAHLWLGVLQRERNITLHTWSTESSFEMDGWVASSLAHVVGIDGTAPGHRDAWPGHGGPGRISVGTGPSSGRS